MEVDNLALPKLRLIHDFGAVLKQEVDKEDRDPQMNRYWGEAFGNASGDLNDIDWDPVQT